MDGIVLIDKPKGWSSFDVVAKLRGQIKRQTGVKRPKVGHTGTLDPLASGLLVLVVGTYCKRAGEFSKLDKVYETELTLGQTSTTDDNEGTKTVVSDRIPSEEEITAVLHTFVGEQLQLPPAFSAIKVGGQRAYKLARAGKEVVMEPRRIQVHEITRVVYEYPRLCFTVSVSSGTYIRSLARDIGERLGTGAYMSGLIRTSVGPYRLVDATIIEDFQLQDIRHI
jgi:tRNA pseudouridine55 synthase